MKYLSILKGFALIAILTTSTKTAYAQPSLQDSICLDVKDYDKLLNVGVAWLECDSVRTIQSLVIQKQASSIENLWSIHLNDSILALSDAQRIEILSTEITEKNKLLKSEKLRRWISVGSSIIVTAIVTNRITRK